MGEISIGDTILGSCSWVAGHVESKEWMVMMIEATDINEEWCRELRDVKGYVEVTRVPPSSVR